ncbi:hypothetical protein [Nocardia brasiliensis]|uniref:hypothetical protein n=1 Tax=Nocardia brasiliensis TaxID=37326 RepID=UPI0018945AAC|nr:hypothetical protein [Nocardia brasiliensis]MBF6126584.1 hypothetical protein [Nocardia brasiliensis]
MTDTATAIQSLLGWTTSRGFDYPVLLSESLPSQDRLLTAIAGHLSGPPELLKWAQELGDPQASRIPGTMNPHRRAAATDAYAVHARIAGRESEINSWAIFHVPRTAGARRHTHSLGEVISHIARTYAHVWWTALHTVDHQNTQTSNEQKQHDAWFHLAEIKGYVDLVDDLAARLVQLPLGWLGVQPIHPPPSA